MATVNIIVRIEIIYCVNRSCSSHLTLLLQLFRYVVTNEIRHCAYRQLSEEFQGGSMYTENTTRSSSIA